MKQPITPTSTATTSAAALSFLTAVGGVVGYVRKGSIPSIAAGTTVGALYALSFLRLTNNKYYGQEIGLLASGILGAGAVPRVIKTGGKPVPLLLLALSVYGTAVFGLAVRDKGRLFT